MSLAVIGGTSMGAALAVHAAAARTVTAPMTRLPDDPRGDNVAAQRRGRRLVGSFMR